MAAEARLSVTQGKSRLSPPLACLGPGLSRDVNWVSQMLCRAAWPRTNGFWFQAACAGAVSPRCAGVVMMGAPQSARVCVRVSVHELHFWCHFHW